MTAAAACVRECRDERGESRDRLLWAQNEGALHEEVDDQPEDRAAPDELTEAHGILPAKAEKRTVPYTTRSPTSGASVVSSAASSFGTTKSGSQRSSTTG